MIALLAGVIIIVSAIYAIWTKDMLASVISLGITGVATTAYFLILQAPDVAMAEAAVGAGIIPLIFVVTISKTQRMEK